MIDDLSNIVICSECYLCIVLLESIVCMNIADLIITLAASSTSSLGSEPHRKIGAIREIIQSVGMHSSPLSC